MTTAYSTLLGLAKPVTGELSGTWGDTVNNYITDYLDAAVAGAQVISGSQTAVTLSKTTGSSLSQAAAGTTGSSQYQIIRCTGNPASLLTITAPAADKTYIVINATSTSQSVKIVGAGPTTGVTISSGTMNVVAWNGTDFTTLNTSSASTATNLAGGTASQIPYQSSANTTAFIANGTSGQVLTSNGASAPSWQSPASTATSVIRNAKTGAYTLAAADKGNLIDCTTGTFTLSVTAAATLGSGWWCYVGNSGSGLVTIDPNASETITVNGQALSTWVLWTNEMGIIECDGTNFYYYQLQKGFITQTVSSAVASIVFSGCLAYRPNMVLSWSNMELSATDQVKLKLNTTISPDRNRGYYCSGSSLNVVSGSSDNFTLGTSATSPSSPLKMSGTSIISATNTGVWVNTTPYYEPSTVGQALGTFSTINTTTITNITIIPNSTTISSGTFILSEI